MKAAAAFALLAVATSASANVIPQPSGTVPLYPLTTVTSTGAAGTGYYYSSTLTSYPTGTGVSPPASTNGTGTAQPTGGATPPPPPSSSSTTVPISGASRNGVGFLALAGAAAAYIMS